jgi:hypothetical protein
MGNPEPRTIEKRRNVLVRLTHIIHHPIVNQKLYSCSINARTDTNQFGARTI